MSTAIGYIRVTMRETQGTTGLSAQRQQIEDYCRQAGLILDSKLCQAVGVPGHTPLSRRLGGAHLLRRLAWQRRTGGPIHHVVVTRLASLFGHAQEALTYLQAWDDSGTALHLVRVGHGESLQTSSPKGRVLHSMLEECLAWQHEQRVDLAWEKKAAPQVYGPARYGFARQGTHLVPKADEQATLAQMRRWQADRWSLRRIVTAPNQAGVPSKQRRRGHPSTVRGLLVAPYPHEGSEFELRGG